MQKEKYSKHLQPLIPVLRNIQVRFRRELLIGLFDLNINIIIPLVGAVEVGGIAGIGSGLVWDRRGGRGKAAEGVVGDPGNVQWAVHTGDVARLFKELDVVRLRSWGVGTNIKGKCGFTISAW
jgi:hypothetical protein